MPTDTYSVQANQTVATQVVFASTPPVATLIMNTSLTGILYISESNTARISDGSGLVPINPNGSIVVDGTRDFYAVTASATPIVVATVAGGLATFLGITQAQGQLVLPSIQSPNYVKGQTGWAIFADGTAEFNDATIRGATLTQSLTAGNTFIINQQGFFVYNGPARGTAPPTNGGGVIGGTTTTQIPNTATAAISGGEPNQTWTKVSDDGNSTAVFTAVA